MHAPSLYFLVKRWGISMHRRCNPPCASQMQTVPLSFRCINRAHRRCKGDAYETYRREYPTVSLKAQYPEACVVRFSTPPQSHPLYASVLLPVSFSPHTQLCFYSPPPHRLGNRRGMHQTTSVRSAFFFTLSPFHSSPYGLHRRKCIFPSKMDVV